MKKNQKSLEDFGVCHSNSSAMRVRRRRERRVEKTVREITAENFPN